MLRCLTQGTKLAQRTCFEYSEETGLSLKRNKVVRKHSLDREKKVSVPQAVSLFPNSELFPPTPPSTKSDQDQVDSADPHPGCTRAKSFRTRRELF